MSNNELKITCITPNGVKLKLEAYSIERCSDCYRIYNNSRRIIGWVPLDWFVIVGDNERCVTVYVPPRQGE